MECIKVGKDKYLVKGSNGLVISEKERIEMGAVLTNGVCEDCIKETKTEKPKTKKKNKKEIKKEEIIEDTNEDKFIEEVKEVEENELIEETTEII